MIIFIPEREKYSYNTIFLHTSENPNHRLRTTFFIQRGEKLLKTIFLKEQGSGGNKNEFKFQFSKRK